MILAATLLWAVEVVLVKWLLAWIPPQTLAAARMGLGTALLLGWLAVSGRLGQLTGLDAEQWRWVLLTGLLLTAYVATWYAALSRAQAIDVTAVLVFGAVVTAVLSGAADGTSISVVGIVLVAAGSMLVVWTALRRPAVERGFVTIAAGPLLFARYAYPPNALGLCGADTPDTLLQYGDARESDGGLAELARTFEGAWPYLDADRRRERHRRSARFASRRGVLGRQRACSSRSGPATSLVTSTIASAVGSVAPRRPSSRRSRPAPCPHHCFHVFAVYPWLGLLRTGVVDEPLRILDQCRTTAAVVATVDGDSLMAFAQPLLWHEQALALGSPEPRRVRWRDGGLAFVPRPRPGDRVSLHWDFVCDVLSPTAAHCLEQVTWRALASVNAAGVALRHEGS